MKFEFDRTLGDQEITWSIRNHLKVGQIPIVYVMREGKQVMGKSGRPLIKLYFPISKLASLWRQLGVDVDMNQLRMDFQSMRNEYEVDSEFARLPKDFSLFDYSQ